MMSAEELQRLAIEVRNELQAVDDVLVKGIEDDVREYRALLAARPAQTPYPPLDKLLPAMAWLIYEASLKPLWKVPPNFTMRTGDEAAEITARVERIFQLADLARMLPWPEYGPRALGALRVAALVESKRDDEAGYDAAWSLHQEAREKAAEFRDALGSAAGRERFVRDLDEVLLPLSLAESGTACRSAEVVIALWAERFADESQRRWTERMFRELTQGAAVGELALATAERIERTYGLVHEIDGERLSLYTSYRNPAIMTGRALLLLYSLCPEMAALGRQPESGTWATYRDSLVVRFDAAFAHLRRDLRDKKNQPIPMIHDHVRSMVQLCLHLALLTPGRELAEELRVDDTLTLRRLDDDAVEAMSGWLARTVNGRQNGDANTIGSASMPVFITSVEECRKDSGSTADYRAWRRRWPMLDRYDGEDGRRERIDRVLSGR